MLPINRQSLRGQTINRVANHRVHGIDTLPLTVWWAALPPLAGEAHSHPAARPASCTGPGCIEQLQWNIARCGSAPSWRSPSQVTVASGTGQQQRREEAGHLRQRRQRAVMD